MVKGINRQVIVVRSPDPSLFEQAIFLLRPDAPESCNVTQDELLRQAQAAAKGYSTAHIPGARLRSRLLGRLFWALAGGGAVGLVWLSRAISGNLSSFGQIIKTVILSVVTYGVLRIFFPDKIKQADPEKPAQQPDAPKQAQTQKTQPQPEEKKQDEPSTGNAELDAVLKQGAASVEKIQSLNDEIPDFKLSAQIKQIEILTEKIFAYVREHPQDIGEIRQFLNYYLPTTIKLLEQYVVLQNQGMRMGNIDEGMRKIESMLDKVIVAFQRQLDGLFESSVVDITADIQVMEQMMASEGLTGKDF